ncbi:UL36 very large tegument protein, partial [Streptomyces sp. ISL-36]|nr:UL36 very large tegument protein [Streptomyces sp. ISL-36]
MTVYQLPVEVAAFARHLGELATRLEPGEGWYGVFASRDPEGLRACFDGVDILPWDVVESLLQDLGEAGTGPGTARARALHGAAATAHDRRPGGREALRERLEVMERERQYAEARSHELGARLRAAPASPDASGLNNELAWAQDDHRRATARIAELTARLARLASVAGEAGEAGEARGAGESEGAGQGPHAVAPAHAAPKRRPRGARYAWMDEVEEAGEAAPEVVPALPMAAAAPRGARFGGVEAPAAPAPATTAGEGAEGEGAAEAARAAGNAVYALRRLRAQGRGGEAHALL